MNISYLLDQEHSHTSLDEGSRSYEKTQTKPNLPMTGPTRSTDSPFGTYSAEIAAVARGFLEDLHQEALNRRQVLLESPTQNMSTDPGNSHRTHRNLSSQRGFISHYDDFSATGFSDFTGKETAQESDGPDESSIESLSIYPDDVSTARLLSICTTLVAVALWFLAIDELLLF